jgi:hypothetical protein
MNPRLLLLALLCLLALPTGASAQPFWPDPDDAYPYAEDPYESLDYANSSFTARMPAPEITITVTPISQTPTIAQSPPPPGQKSVAPNYVRFVAGSQVDGAVTRFDIVYQTTRETGDVPSRINLRLQAKDSTGRLVGERTVSATRQWSAGTTQRYQAPATRLRCPESDGYLSCADETSPLDQAIVRSATTALPPTSWGTTPEAPSFDAPDWQPSYEDEE